MNVGIVFCKYVLWLEKLCLDWEEQVRPCHLYIIKTLGLQSSEQEPNFFFLYRWVNFDQEQNDAEQGIVQIDKPKYIFRLQFILFHKHIPEL